MSENIPEDCLGGRRVVSLVQCCQQGGSWSQISTLSRFPDVAGGTNRFVLQFLLLILRVSSVFKATEIRDNGKQLIAIGGFGQDMPHRLVKPILQRCNADILSRLEQESPVSATPRLCELCQNISHAPSSFSILWSITKVFSSLMTVFIYNILF